MANHGLFMQGLKMAERVTRDQAVAYTRGFAAKIRNDKQVGKISVRMQRSYPGASVYDVLLISKGK